MQPGLSPFGSFLLNPIPYLHSNGELSNEGFDGSRFFFLPSLWLLQGGGNMDLSKVGERILSSVRSARSLGLLPSTSDRPEVPARAAAAAAVARALASLPPHQRISLPSSSAELSSIYGSRPHDEVVEELEEEFYEEKFDPVRHLLEKSPPEENELEYFEKKATVRLTQLDQVAERLSKHVMANHEEMVKGMHLVRELERDLQIATVICMNGRRHLTSSMNEVSRDLIVTSNSKKKQALLDMLPVLTELCHGLEMQRALERHVEGGNYCKAFQVLSEYLQLLDSLSELAAVQEMSRGVEVWLAKTLQKLDSLLLQVCQDFKEEKYVTVVDAYSLIGDVSGLAEKIQSFFMQEVLSETHSLLKTLVHEDQDIRNQENSCRLTYSDLCLQIPESKFRQCLLKTLAELYRLMCSYYAIMSFQPEVKGSAYQEQQNRSSLRSESDKKVNSTPGSFDSRHDNDSRATSASFDRLRTSDFECSLPSTSGTNSSVCLSSNNTSNESVDEENAASSSGSPWYDLRKDATAFVSQSLQRGRKNLWQLITSRISVLLSSTAFSSTSIHQFLRNYEDLNIFILAGDAFCGVEATEFRHKLKAACENYFANFHRQNIYGLKMVLERENWQQLPPDAIEVITFAGLVGDGGALIALSDRTLNAQTHHSGKLVHSFASGINKSAFAEWLKKGNPFLSKVSSPSREGQASSPFSDGAGASGKHDQNSTDHLKSDKHAGKNDANIVNGNNSTLEEENEDLLADFIDEESQLPSRISKPGLPRNRSTQWKDEEITIQTGSSLCLLRYMDKYGRLMQKLEIVNVELFKGICQLFAVYYQFVFETFGQQSSCSNGKGLSDSLNYRLKTALNKATQDYDQWIRPQLAQSLSSQSTFNASFKLTDVTPTSPPHSTNASLGLKERCTGADTISLVAQILHRAKPHLQSMLLQNNAAVVEDFFENLVDSVPDLTEHIHRTTARLLLHIDGYVDRIANAKWELKELGMEHNGYVDLLLGEFKHYKTRLAHGGIHMEVQELLLEYGVEIVAETLVEGLSRVKRCTDEGRALMSLDLQVLINGLRHFVSKDARPKLQIVEAFIKAYYLPETEFVHWARAHPEYTKSQIVGLINLVAVMKGWKRKTRLEILEKIE